MPLSYFESKIEYALPYGKVVGKTDFFALPSFLLTPWPLTPGKINIGKDGMVKQVEISIDSLYGEAENSVIKIK